MTESQVAVNNVSIDGHSLTLEDVQWVARDFVKVNMSDRAHRQIDGSRAVVDRFLKEERVVYGITTGFGKFKDIVIRSEDCSLLQRNLLLSHAAGVSTPFDATTVRAIMLLRANALAKGYSGIRAEVVELLLALLNKQVHPIVPEQGSLGASGDLAPLAHLALVLIGEGEAQVNGKRLSGRAALEHAGL